METIHLAVALIAGLALLTGVIAHWQRLHWFNQPVLALLLGVLVGLEALDSIDLEEHGDPVVFIEIAALLTLAVALVGVGLQLRGFLTTHLRTLSLLVLFGTALMWGASTVILALLLELDFLTSLLLGAVIAPIDPILSATVATGRVARDNLPTRLRLLLSGEAAARHGLGLLFVLLPALLLTKPDGEAWNHWLTDILLWKGLAAVLIGGAIGYTLGRLHAWSARRDFLESQTGPLITLLPALALLTVAALEYAGSDGLLAVLAAGVAFAWARTSSEKSEEVEHQERLHEETLKQVLQVPVFFLLGLALPWAEWGDLGWRAPALVIAVLLLRRIPALLLISPLLRGTVRRMDEALFVGWFGPIGVGALYLATVAEKETGNSLLWPVTTLLVAATVVVHDLTATPLSQWLAARIRAGEEASTR